MQCNATMQSDLLVCSIVQCDAQLTVWFICFGDHLQCDVRLLLVQFCFVMHVKHTIAIFHTPSVP